MIGVPLDVQRMTNAHYDALMREFEFLRQSENAAGSLPAKLLDLVDELSSRFEQFAQQPRAVLQAALDSEHTFKGLTGPDRHVLYLTACATGFRAEELACLRPEFDFCPFLRGLAKKEPS